MKPHVQAPLETISAEVSPAPCWGRWWRPLLPSERAFILRYFGAEQAHWLALRIRLGLRRIGDTRRALSAPGGWVSLPRSCYEGGHWQQALRLWHPAVAGIFAHELLHALQRRYGRRVTIPALCLQCQFLLWRKDPYSYSCSPLPIKTLKHFWRANVEQQGQMWQDWITSAVAGQPMASHALLAYAVRRGRLQVRCRCSAGANSSGAL